ncbi:MAG: hypothetical protein RJA22_2403 [Verrucomicrobiota bacterium]|jgi:hypothetical protein
MKVVLVILVALLLGALVGQQYQARRQSVSEAQAWKAASGWAAEKALLEQQLAEARRGAAAGARPAARTPGGTTAPRATATELIQRLTRLHPDSGEETRNRTLRQIVHQLQLLADLGPEALPAIRQFLRANQDLDYSQDILNAAGERVTRSGPASWSTRAGTRTDFLVPPSLRLGLLDVVEQIGGEEAQAILAETLDSSGRGVEVAYLARALQGAAPGRHREAALKAARELLTNPVPAGLPNRIDDNARAYLYQVLALHQDTSFAPVAQAQLVGAEGRVDRHALEYLSGMFKEQAVPALYEACRNPKLTNQAERAVLVAAVLAYAGPSVQANQLLAETLVREDIPAGVRAYTVQGLAGGPGRETPSDPAVIQARIELLRTLRSQTREERLLLAIDETRAALERLTAGTRP